MKSLIERNAAAQNLVLFFKNLIEKIAVEN
jgi:hypothetical protein